MSWAVRTLSSHSLAVMMSSAAVLQQVQILHAAPAIGDVLGDQVELIQAVPAEGAMAADGFMGLPGERAAWHRADALGALE